MVKIIIIGAGISGLSTYLFLRKHLISSSTSPEDPEIKIYEAYDIHQSNFNASSGNPTTHDPVNALPTNETEPIFTPQAIGSAIGISKNGLSVLSRLDDNAPEGAVSGSSITEQMSLHGHPIERWEISTARGFTIVEVNLAAMAKQKKSNPPTPGKEDEDPNLYHGIMIARQACWEVLRDRVLQVSPGVVVKKKVVDVSIGDGNSRNNLMFEDGSQEEADLVIGADGVRSSLRRAMFREDEDVMARGQTQSNRPGISGEENNTSLLQTLLSYIKLGRHSSSNVKKRDLISPHYEGLVGVGGFVPSSILQSTGQKPGSMSIVFGPNGFFGCGYLTSQPYTTSSQSSDSTTPNTDPSTTAPGPIAGWWSTFSSPSPYPYSSEGFNKPLALSALLARHSTWSNPTITAILTYVKTDTEQHGSQGKGLDASYPTWTTPELPTWSKNGRVVLVGDAAHALQPSSGQGACQALEDSEALALFLKHYISSRATTSPSSELEVATVKALSATEELHPRLTQALRSYTKFRTPRLHEIYLRSQTMSSMKGDMNVLMEWTMYLAIWMMTWRLWQWLGVNDTDKYNEGLFGYDLPQELEKFLAKEVEGGE